MRQFALLLFFGVVAANLLSSNLTVEEWPQDEQSICQDHKVDMKRKVVPITYGLPDWSRRYSDAGIHSFPHAADHMNGGCIVRVDWTRRYAVVFSCPRCETNWTQWLKENRNP